MSNYWNSTFQIREGRTPLRSSKQMKKSGRLRPKRKSVKGDTAWYEQQLDDVVSLIVRAITPFCVLCGESDPENLTCGHFWKRFRRPTRWHMDNLATLCFQCNDRDNTEHSHFEYWIFNKLGERGYADLAELAHCSKVFTASELEEMLDGLKEIHARLKRSCIAGESYL